MAGHISKVIAAWNRTGFGRRQLFGLMGTSFGVAALTKSSPAIGAAEGPQPNTTTFSNIAICVADLDRAVRFYSEALGFTPGDNHAFAGAIFGKQLSVGDTAKLRTRTISLDMLRIELIQFEAPSHSANPLRLPTNQPGLTHLSFRVADLDKTIAAVAKFGGVVLPETRITLGKLEVMFCRDPNGVRLEIGHIAT